MLVSPWCYKPGPLKQIGKFSSQWHALVWKTHEHVAKLREKWDSLPWCFRARLLQAGLLLARARMTRWWACSQAISLAVTVLTEQFVSHLVNGRFSTVIDKSIRKESIEDLLEKPILLVLVQANREWFRLVLFGLGTDCACMFGKRDSDRLHVLRAETAETLSALKARRIEAVCCWPYQTSKNLTKLVCLWEITQLCRMNTNRNLSEISGTCLQWSQLGTSLFSVIVKPRARAGGNTRATRVRGFITQRQNMSMQRKNKTGWKSSRLLTIWMR